MNIYNMDLNDRNFFYCANIGFEFEFFSNLSKKEIAKDLSRLLGKNILIFNRYHSKFIPTKDTFKLEPDYSGGSKMVELITGPLPYFESITILIKILKWIDANGYTDKKCAFQFGVSIDTSIYPKVPKIEKLNILKFILGFDENMIYKRFPDRENSLYAKSIKKRIIPSNKFVDPSELAYIDKNLFNVPIEKNMGINFLKLPEGYFEVRYLGGTDYQKKYSQIKEIIDYIITYTLQTLQSNESFNDNDLKTLKIFLKEIYKNASAFINAEKFYENYPLMHVLVDLKSDLQILKSFFIKIREVLYDLIVDNNIIEGEVNYDSDRGKFQLRGVKTNKAYLLKDYDILESEISGNLLDCKLFASVIEDSTIEDCDIITSNEINRSKILYSDILYNNTISDCYIDNKTKEINGEIKGGIIRSGYIGDSSRVSKETEIIGDPEDDKKMKGSSKKSIFNNKNNVPEVSVQAFKNKNTTPLGIPGTGFKQKI